MDKNRSVLNEFDEFYKEMKEVLITDYNKSEESIRKVLNHLEKVINFRNK